MQSRSCVPLPIFGSVSLKVLHDSHIPVLLIRPESAGKSHFLNNIQTQKEVVP